MSQKPTEREPDPKILAELSALADGTLDAGRAAQLRQQLDASPELRSRFEHQHQAVLALRSLTADRAPASLRLAIEARKRPAPARRGRLLYGGALAASAALAATLLALLLPGGPGAPSVSQAAALAFRGPAMPAPASTGRKLTLGVGEIYFPNWAPLGWRSSGWRTDDLRGRLAMTVYYKWHGKQIAYTILAAPPLRRPDARIVRMDGIAIQSFPLRGRLVVTWRRDGHTCVLSGQGMSTAELARLAGWSETARGE